MQDAADARAASQDHHPGQGLLCIEKWRFPRVRPCVNRFARLGECLIRIGRVGLPPQRPHQALNRQDYCWACLSMSFSEPTCGLVALPAPGQLWELLSTCCLVPGAGLIPPGCSSATKPLQKPWQLETPRCPGEVDLKWHTGTSKLLYATVTFVSFCQHH